MYLVIVSERTHKSKEQRHHKADWDHWSEWWWRDKWFETQDSYSYRREQYTDQAFRRDEGIREMKTHLTIFSLNSEVIQRGIR